MKKLLYICEHMSTGGMPAYVLKQIESFRDQFEISVCEVKFYGADYVVHRNKVEDLVDFHSLYGQQSKLNGLIRKIKPDIIHIQEVPESFLESQVLRQLYNVDREYNIVVTSHSSLTRREDFKYLPDKVVAVNKWQRKLFEQELPEASVDMWEYPIENKRPTPEEIIMARWSLEHFSFHDPEKKILNVGLFTPGKNQGELFEIARKNPKYHYHFVGNQAVNFKEYWEPLMKDRPDNCYVWGERDDTDMFYKACDEFWFTSKFELNPLVIKEALSYGMPVKMHKLATYMNDYDDNPLVTYF